MYNSGWTVTGTYAGTHFVAIGGNDPFGSGLTVDSVVGWRVGNDDSFTGRNLRVNADLTSAAYGSSVYSVVAAGSENPAHPTLDGNSLEMAAGSKVGGSVYAAGANILTAATVKNNTLTFSGNSTVGGFVGGGAAFTGNMELNKVVVSHAAGAVDGGMGLYGAALGTGGGLLKDNSVEVGAIAGSLTVARLVGASALGRSSVATVFDGNKVTVSGTGGGAVAVSEYVAGAYVSGQDASLPPGTEAWHRLSNNTASLDRGNVQGFIAGAYAGGGDSALSADPVSSAVFDSNSVTISGTVGVGGSIYGAASSFDASNTLNNNSVTITGQLAPDSVSSTYVDFIYGAVGGAGNAANNSVTITPSGSFRIGDDIQEGDIAGAITLYGQSGDLLTLNSVTIHAGTNNLTISGFVYGGNTGYGGGTLTKNVVTIDGNVYIGGNVYGAQTANGIVRDNHVKIQNASATTLTIGRSIYGGYVSTGITNTAAAEDNTVTLVNTNLESHYSSTDTHVYGGYMETVGNGNVSNNSVSLTSSTANVVAGGWLKGNSSGSVVGNTVRISSSNVRDIYGGYREGGTGSAIGNSVLIDGGATASNLTGNIFGGYVDNTTGTADRKSVV
jgi:hypothetical protein